MKFEKLFILCIELKRITKNAYNNRMNLIQILSYKTDTLFINLGNSKNSDSRRRVFKDFGDKNKFKEKR